MASAVCAELPVAANTAANLVSPAASTSDLQINKQKKKKHRRVGQSTAALLPSNSMCEAPDACWPSTSTSVAAACADSPASHQLNGEQDAPAAPQQHPQASRQPQSPMQAATGMSSRGKAATAGNPAAADASSNAGKGSGNKFRRQGGGSPAHAAAAAAASGGAGGGDDTDDADALRRRKLAGAKNGQRHAASSKQQPPAAEHAPAADAGTSKQGLSVDVAAAAAAQAAATAAISAISPTQQPQQAANGRSSPVANGYTRGHGPKHSQQQQFSSCTAVEQPQGWQIQFGDVPVVLGSPPAQEAVGDFASSRTGKGSRGYHQHQHNPQQQQQQDGAQLQHSSSTQSCPAAAAEQVEERRLKGTKGSGSSLANSEPAGGASSGKLQNGRTQQQTHSKGAVASGAKQGSKAAAVAVQAEQQDCSLTPQPSPKQRQAEQQQQQQRQIAEPAQPEELSRGPAPGMSGKASQTPPASPKLSASPILSPALLKQFGLRVAPLNGYKLPGEAEIRATIQELAPMVLVAKEDPSSSPSAPWKSPPLKGMQGNGADKDIDGSSQPQQQQQVPGSPAKGHSKQQGQGSSSSSSSRDGLLAQQQPRQQHAAEKPASPGKGAGLNRKQMRALAAVQQQEQQQQQQVLDPGVDDCSIASSSSSLPVAVAAAGVTRSASGPVVNAWQANESAVVALQLAAGAGAAQSLQQQGASRGHSSTSAWLQQQQQPQQQYGGPGSAAGVVMSVSSLQLSHMDRSDIMSDPGTVPGGGFAALGYEGSASGYGRMKAGGRHNRFMPHHTMHQQHIAAGPVGGYYGQGGGMQPFLGGNGSGARKGGGNKEEGAGSGGSRRGGAAGGGGMGARRGSKGSLDVYLPRSPQVNPQANAGGNGSGNTRRSFDVRYYQQQQGAQLTGGGQQQQGGQHSSGSRGNGSSGRQTPLLSPQGSRRQQQQQQQGNSPHLPPSSSSGSLAGHPSPLLLPEPALLPPGASSHGRRPSSSSGMLPMPDLPPSAAGFLPPSGPCTDLERLLAAVGPTLQVSPALTVTQAREVLTLKSVWDVFMEPSLWGLPVPTLGGPRGQSTAYYVPYMSAMQLFTRIEEPTPASPQSQRTAAPAAAASGSSSSPSSSSAGCAAGSTSDSSSKSGSGSGSASPLTAGSSGSSSSCPSYAAAVAAGTAAAGNVQPPTPPGLQRQESLNAAASAATAAVPVGPGGRGRLYACNVKGWPRTMRLLLEHMEQELPFSRDPFYLQLEAMAGGQEAAEAVEAATAASSGTASPALGSIRSPSPAALAAAAAAAAAGGFTACGYPLVGPDLMGTKLTDVHPASWFAVAWYPVYRIPDAPLTARFLAFYSFSQLQDVLQGALAAPGLEPTAPCQLAGLPMPVVGLKWYNTMTERWLDLLAVSTGSRDGSSGGGGSSSGRQGRLGDSSDGESSAVQVLRMSQSRLADWHARLDDLQVTAARLAKGLGLKVLTPQGSKEVRLYHSDYEFFNSRGS